MSNQTKNVFKSDFKNNHKKEILTVFLLASFLFISISILSFNPKDNTFIHFSNKNCNTSNLAGIIGANIAALFFCLLGTTTYIFLLCFMATLYLLCIAKNLTSVKFRFFGLLLFFISIVTFFGFLNLELFPDFSGGMLGNLFINYSHTITGFYGSIITMLAMFWIGAAIFLCLPLSPYIRVVLTKLGNYLTTLLNLISKFKILKFQFSKMLHKKKSSSNNTIIPASDFSRTFELDIEYWKSIFDKPKNVTTAICVDKNDINKHCDLTEIDQTWESGNTNTSSQSHKYILPDVKIFTQYQSTVNFDEIKKESFDYSKKLEEKLLCFGVKGKIVSVKPGPVITMYEYKPEIDSKISKITAAEDDLAMALTAKSIRILAPIPGKNAVGFEISNKTRQDVYFSNVIASASIKQGSLNLPLLLGVDVTGKPVFDDLAKMPHLLVGGTTGSGKSVGLHSMLISLLFHLSPTQLKLILIDPKRLEFGVYADIPHLLFPIITSPDVAISSLKWVTHEMEERYIKMASSGTRNINEYHDLVKTGADLPPLPFIVVIIDELADLMMVGGKDLELQIIRIAQMARAAGIHIIMATQRPSVEVVTGLIKVNFPSRISFRVSSKIDSRTILDSSGAEKLLGRGDSLSMNSSSPDLLRIHGAYVSDKEIKNVVEWWKNQKTAEYLNLKETLQQIIQQENSTEQEDEIYGQVVDFIKNNDEISISLLQRYFRIGFNRSARLIERLEIDGLISSAQAGSKTRKVLR